MGVLWKARYFRRINSVLELPKQVYNRYSSVMDYPKFALDVLLMWLLVRAEIVNWAWGGWGLGKSKREYVNP